MSVNIWQINDVSKVTAQPGPPKQKEWWGTYEVRYNGTDPPLHVEKFVNTGEFSFKILDNNTITGTAKGKAQYIGEGSFIEGSSYCHGQGSTDVTRYLGGDFYPEIGQVGLVFDYDTDPNAYRMTAKFTCPDGAFTLWKDVEFPTAGNAIDLKNGAIFETSHEGDFGEGIQKHYYKITIFLPVEKLIVDVLRPELSPLEKPIPIGKVTVTAMIGNTPLNGVKIEVKACTEPGKANTDGHLHDKRTDACVKGNRPIATLVYGKTTGNPIEVTTDGKGKAELFYFPPSHPTPKYQIFISGKDKIIATSKVDPKVKGESSITTKVPGLLALAGSSDCKSTGQNYFFESQGGHACLFYGTSGTNAAIIRIADAFAGNQTKCIRNYLLTPGAEPCIIKDDKNADYSVTISMGNIKVIPTKITAMSLPWGGLLDIGPKGCKKCVEWKPPHNTHTTGKELDIGFGNLLRTDGKTETISCTVKDKETKKDKVITKKISYDINRILLLRHIITQDTNFGRLISYEGGTLAKTFCQDAPHIHVDFKN